MDMVLDLIFALILFVMFAIGAWRGAVISGSGLFGLIAGYGGGILAATNGSSWVARTLVVSPLAAPAVAGTTRRMDCARPRVVPDASATLTVKG